MRSIFLVALIICLAVAEVEVSKDDLCNALGVSNDIFTVGSDLCASPFGEVISELHKGGELACAAIDIFLTAGQFIVAKECTKTVKVQPFLFATKKSSTQVVHQFTIVERVIQAVWTLSMLR